MTTTLKKELIESQRYKYDYLERWYYIKKRDGVEHADKIFLKLADILDSQGIQGPGENGYGLERASKTLE